MFPVFWFLNLIVYAYTEFIFRCQWVSLTTTWRDLRIRMEEQHPIWTVDANFEKAVKDSRQGVVFQVGDWARR